MKILCTAAVMCVLSVAPAAANLLTNGSFETGTDPGSFTTINSPDNTAIMDWTVSAGSVDYIGTYWQAQDGGRSIDLSGNSQGSLSTTFNGVAGQQYLLTFYVAGNPDGDPVTKTGAVNVTTGALQQTLSFTNTASTTKDNMGWLPVSYTFTGSGGPETLTFSSTTGTAYGLALDNVALSAVPLPPALPMFGAALLGLGIFGFMRRRANVGTVTAAFAT